MRSKLLFLLNSALLGLGVFCAFGASMRATTARQAATEYGPALSRALELVFNDPVLTKQGLFGTSRDPLTVSHGGAIEISRRNLGDLSESQSALMKLRDSVRESGFQVEQGVFAPKSGPVFDPKVPGIKEFETFYAVSWMTPKPAEKTLFPDRFSTQQFQPSDVNSFGETVYNLAKAKSVTIQKNDYWIYAAPVRFQHEECLSCHREAKVGDTACVVALAFRTK